MFGYFLIFTQSKKILEFDSYLFLSFEPLLLPPNHFPRPLQQRRETHRSSTAGESWSPPPCDLIRPPPPRLANHRPRDIRLGEPSGTLQRSLWLGTSGWAEPPTIGGRNGGRCCMFRFDVSWQILKLNRKISKNIT